MTYWSGKRVLVTGAGGFIGSHLVEALVARGASVRALAHYNSRGHWGHLEKVTENTRSAIDVRMGDITDQILVRGLVNRIDIVFHLAALIGIPYSYDAVSSYIMTNVMGTLNILQACREATVERLIHTSTSEVYGTALYTAIDEKHPLQAQSPYSASKIAADQMAEAFWRSYAVPVVIARPFNTYGPRQSARAVIPTIVAQLLQSSQVRLGQLDSVRDFTYVTDTVDGLTAVGQTDACVGQVVNLGTGDSIKIRDLAERIAVLMGKKIAIIKETERLRPERSEVFTLICNNQKARQLTGWAPKTLLDEGLSRVIEYVRRESNEYKPSQYNI